MADPLQDQELEGRPWEELKKFLLGEVSPDPAGFFLKRKKAAGFWRSPWPGQFVVFYDQNFDEPQEGFARLGNKDLRWTQVSMGSLEKMLESDHWALSSWTRSMAEALPLEDTRKLLPPLQEKAHMKLTKGRNPWRDEPLVAEQYFQEVWSGIRKMGSLKDEFRISHESGTWVPCLVEAFYFFKSRYLPDSEFLFEDLQQVDEAFAEGLKEFLRAPYEQKSSLAIDLAVRVLQGYQS